MIVEAYRHLVDPLEDDGDRAALLATVRPRVLVTCDVDVSMLLDLRTPGARSTAGLTISELTSPTDDQDAYLRCQRVAQIAHQLGRHGIIAPAATSLGDTLALFTDLLPPNERPLPVEGTEEHWNTLPDDPRVTSSFERHLRVVGDVHDEQQSNVAGGQLHVQERLRAHVGKHRSQVPGMRPNGPGEVWRPLGNGGNALGLFGTNRSWAQVPPPRR